MKKTLIIIFLSLIFISSNQPVFSYKFLPVKLISKTTSTNQLREWWNNMDYEWQWVFLNSINSKYKKPTDKELKFFTSLKELSRDSIHLRTLEPVKMLHELRVLEMANNEIKDISPIKHLIKLEELIISANSIKDIRVLNNLKNLKVLNLSSTEINNLNSLQDLSKLNELTLNENNTISIKPLYHLKNLRKLSILDTKVNKSELKEFKRINPECLVISNTTL